MSTDTCPKCRAAISHTHSLFTYYGCGSYQGDEFHRSERCKRNCDPHESRGPLDKSSCCGAPIDTSRSIQSGRYEGHGRYYCSKCGRLAYIV